MPRNNVLLMAARAREDEFYTQLTDIEKELRPCRGHFVRKTVPCNCDDAFESNFFRYSVLNFHSLGLKKLLATRYAGSTIAHKSLFDVPRETEGGRFGVKPWVAEATVVRDMSGDGGMGDIAQLCWTGEKSL